MKALVVNALGGGFDLEDVQVAATSRREVLVDVQASGLCHTDLLFAMYDIVPMPAVLGHELAGIVAEVGPNVAQFRVGDQGQHPVPMLMGRRKLGGWAEINFLHRKPPPLRVVVI
jgi:Zn-dependent alcohol dehydrogenase